MKTLNQQQKQVEESKLKQELENAKIRLDAAKAKAEAILTTGKAEAAVIMSQNEAEVAGLKTSVQGFGSAANFAHFQMLKQMAPALREIFASDESDFAKIFASYMNAPLPPATGKPVATLPEAPAADSVAGTSKTPAPPANGPAGIGKTAPDKK
jgi:hypothetical protein